MTNLAKMAKLAKFCQLFLAKVEDIMQMSCLKGPIESGGYGKNDKFGENGETGKILLKSDECGRYYANELS